MGVYNTLMKELEDESDEEFQSFARVPPDLYLEIVRRVGPRIQKQHTFFRKALSPGLKGGITRRFLGAGISYHSLAYEFRCLHNTISLVISETCEAIIAEYMEESIKCPKTPRGVERSGTRLFREMELTQRLWGTRWQACGSEVSNRIWLYLLQL